MGLGNVHYGDDGLGVRLAEELKSTQGADNVVVAGTAPERFIGRAADEHLDRVVFLDAVDFGGAPGSVVLLDSRELAARFPQISTHKLSLGLLARQIEANGRTRAWLLGVQPGSLKPCDALTPAVQATLELLIELLTACLGGRSSSRAGQRDLSPVATGAATIEVMA